MQRLRSANVRLSRIEINRITPADYEQISDIICRCLTQVNIRDYGEEHIAKMLPAFAPDTLGDWFNGADTFVIRSTGAVVGTGTLRGSEIQTVFVDPEYHGSGFGRRLMEQLESLARSRGVSEITLRSSLTSRSFYERLDYRVQGTTYGSVGGEMILMSKKL